MTEQKRVPAYPVVVLQPLSSYLGDADPGDRARRASAALSELVRDVCAMDAVVSVVDISPANDEPEAGGKGIDTWNTAVILAIFHNVTLSELEKYSQQLDRALVSTPSHTAPHRLLDGKAYAELPPPSVFVPSKEWIDEQKSYAAGRAKAHSNSDTYKAPAPAADPAPAAATGSPAAASLDDMF